jgi:glycosyltransferase involved in cell wall biosynthesis
MMHNLAVIILTLNEEIHIKRAIASAKTITDYIFVIDSYSSDSTCFLARESSAVVLQHNFKTHADQFNWAITQLPDNIEWIFRLDADEYLSDKLVKKINSLSPHDLSINSGFSVSRTFVFQETILRYGGARTTPIRLFKRDSGRCETKYMDEHIVVNGLSTHISAYLYDHNQKGLTSWLEKHNKYSSLECIDYNLSHHNRTNQSGYSAYQANKYKIYLKDHLYNRLPLRLRAIVYFIYRFFFLLGFLDGINGFSFHFLQCLWYRYIVDLKIIESKKPTLSSDEFFK